MKSYKGLGRGKLAGDTAPLVHAISTTASLVGSFVASENTVLHTGHVYLCMPMLTTAIVLETFAANEKTIAPTGHDLSLYAHTSNELPTWSIRYQ